MLARRFPWQQQQAAWFVLTDVVPTVSPLRLSVVRQATRDHIHFRVVLEVEPWASADAVQRAYRRAQRDVIGGDNRPLGPRSLALFRYLTSQMDSDGILPAWRPLMSAWNSEFPDWRYQEVRLFARDSKRALMALLGPQYRMPGQGHTVVITLPSTSGTRSRGGAHNAH